MITDNFYIIKLEETVCGVKYTYYYADGALTNTPIYATKFYNEKLLCDLKCSITNYEVKVIKVKATYELEE